MLKDETGNKYGVWAVVSRCLQLGGNQCSWWECRCERGHIKNIRGQALREGKYLNRCKECPPPTSKACTKCTKIKPVQEFGKVSRPGRLHHSWCKKCRSIEGKTYRTKYPEKIKQKQLAQRDWHNAYLKRWCLKKRYGITLEEYKAMEAKQGGVCAVCREPEITKNRSGLVVDHCHKTNKVRGLLCHKCNSAIGKLGDTSHGVMRAVRYLMQFESAKAKE